MNQDDRMEMILGALDGLVPLVVMEGLSRCADPDHPTVAELWPSETERAGAVECLAMADYLVAGAMPGEKRGGGLAALAKAVFWGSLVPGGIDLLGHNWAFNGAARAVIRKRIPKHSQRIWRQPIAAEEVGDGSA